MKKRMALVFLYLKENRLSFNALTGALEVYDDFVDLPVFFIETKSDFITRLPESIRDYKKVVLEIFLAITCFALPTDDSAGALAMGFDVVVRGEGDAESGRERFMETLKNREKWQKKFRDI